MRAIFAFVLLFASTGMIYAGFTADAPVPGIDYDIPVAIQDDCPAQASSGDRLLSLVSGGSSHSTKAPDDSSGRLLEYLSCLL